MSQNKNQSKPPLQMRLLLASALLILSGLNGIRAGKQTYNMIGARSLTPGIAAPTEIVYQNWMYPVGLLSLCAGVVTLAAAGVVTIRHRQ